jgi:hypothetical protein
VVTRRRGSLLTVIAVAFSIAACVFPFEGDDLEGLDLERAEIVGGALESGFPLVGTLAQPLGGTDVSPFCTATAVTPTVLITAAHCTDAFIESGWEVTFARSTPDGAMLMNAVEASSRINHPQWVMYDWEGLPFDIALVRLSERIDADVFPALHRRAESTSDLGTTLEVVGYGVSEPPDG